MATRKPATAVPAAPAAAKKSPAAKTSRAATKSPAVKKPVAATPVPAPAPAPAAAAPAPEKKREKLVRDSFTLPKGEYAALAALKKRAEGLARPAKKSEVVRAGIALLTALDDAALLAALAAVPAIKTGRPAKG